MPVAGALPGSLPSGTGAENGVLPAACRGPQPCRAVDREHGHAGRAPDSSSLTDSGWAANHSRINAIQVGSAASAPVILLPIGLLHVAPDPDGAGDARVGADEPCVGVLVGRAGLAGEVSAKPAALTPVPRWTTPSITWVRRYATSSCGTLADLGLGLEDHLALGVLDAGDEEGRRHLAVVDDPGVRRRQARAPTSSNAPRAIVGYGARRSLTSRRAASITASPVTICWSLTADALSEELTERSAG